MTRKLYHKDGREALKGDPVTSFRGEPYIITGWPTDGHNRVWVRSESDAFEHEFFPGVFDLSWEKPS